MLQHYWKDTWSGMIFESRLFIIKYWLVTSEWLILKCVKVCAPELSPGSKKAGPRVCVWWAFSVDHEEVQAPTSRGEVEECKPLQWPSTWPIFYTTDPVRNFLVTPSGETNVPWQNLNGGQAAGVLCLLLYPLLGMFALHKCIVHPQPGISCAAVPGRG